jgi:hypothetical protein
LCTTVVGVVVVVVAIVGGSVVTIVVVVYERRAVVFNSIICTFWAEHCKESKGRGRMCRRGKENDVRKKTREGKTEERERERKREKMAGDIS